MRQEQVRPCQPLPALPLSPLPAVALTDGVCLAHLYDRSDHHLTVYSHTLTCTKPKHAACVFASAVRLQVKHQSLDEASAAPRTFGYAGIMQQAVVLEVAPPPSPGFMPSEQQQMQQQQQQQQAQPRPHYNLLEVLLEGYDGQLPKLDMYHILRSYAMGLPGIELQMRGGPPRPTWLLQKLGSSQVRASLWSEGAAPGARGRQNNRETVMPEWTALCL